MQNNNLRKYFPMIRTRAEVLSIINSNKTLRNRFDKFSLEMREEFLDFCSGAKGIKILYDSFFKEVLNPEYAPERLEWLLSVLLGMKVKIVKVLPVDSGRMGGETSLVAMDIVVELEDGSLINIEMQKIGYLFPGQRSACYAADLLLRQYRRVRSIHEENKTRFRYGDVKPVYTIVFFEKSPAEFHQYPSQYIHYFQQTANTGLEVELLQKYIFIPLDIFKEMYQYKSIESELEAWLLFLSSDKVEDIIGLIEKYPGFRPLYETLYRMCENIEEVMGMFSEELYELDRNTFLFMMDEYERKAKEYQEQMATYQEQAKEYQAQMATYQEQAKEYQEQMATYQEQMATYQQQVATYQQQAKELKAVNERLMAELAALKGH